MRTREGTIIEKNGKIYGKIRFTDSEGVRREKYRQAENKTHAKKLIREMREELEERGSNSLQNDRKTFSELAELYTTTFLIKAVIEDGKKIAGKKSLAPTLAELKPLKAFFGRKMLRNIDSGDLEKYKSERLQTVTKNNTTRKISSVNRELQLLRTMLNFAVRKKFILENPFSSAKSIISKASENERERVLSFDEEKKILAALDSPRIIEYKRKNRTTGEIETIKAELSGDERRHLKPLFLLALDSGMRRGEIFKLRWNDIDFDKNLITVQAQNSKIEKKREIGITNRCRNELLKLNEIPKLNTDSVVFGLSTSIKTAWRSLMVQANVRDFRLHDCRHTAITRWIRAGVPSSEAMKLSGHTQIKTFLRYLNLNSETATNAATMLDNYLNSSVAK